MNKLCTKCGQIKSLKDFRKQSSTKDGYQYQCKSCMKPKLNNYYKENKDKIIENVKEWRKQQKG